MSNMETLYKYYDAVRTDDPDRQVNDGIDIEALEFAIQRINSLDKQVKQLLSTFKHIHVGYGEDICRECGLDIRNPVHERMPKE